MTADQSIFVVNADDLGLSTSANAGIFRAFDDGCLSSASLAVTTTACAPAMEGLRERPDLGVGLHFSLSAGRPIAGIESVPLLVDEDGALKWRFLSLMRAMLGQGRADLKEQVAVELDAQLRVLLDSGVRVDHINGERHVHLIPGVFEIVVQAARKYGIRYLRVIDDVSLRYLKASDLSLTIANGGWIKLAILQALSHRAHRLLRPETEVTSVRYASILFTGRMDRFLKRIWADPPPGITELAVHPGLPGEEGIGTDLGNADLERYLLSAYREAELRICVDLQRIPTPAIVTTFADAYTRSRPHKV